YRYDKHHLVPFGEFIPTGFRWFIDLMHIPLGSFSRGAVDQPSFDWQGQRLAPNICYEDLFGEELAKRFADPARAPTAFVNASNLAWFGDTVALDQHLSIERMRTLEFDRPLISATNTGATAIIDRHGVVTKELPRATRGVLRGEFEGNTHITPYATWAARWGLAPLWILCLLLAAWGVWRLRAVANGDNRELQKPQTLGHN
ncbi:MAG: apolipoprotein N-acyltransferase, partial [Burkholderiaceae bacterium]